MRMFLSVLRRAARDAAMSIATETPTEGKCPAWPDQRRAFTFLFIYHLVCAVIDIDFT